MCTNAGICLLTQSRILASIHYHQHSIDPMLLSHIPRFPYPG